MEMLDRVIDFASKKHAGQIRKGDGKPYIYHPLEVLTIAAQLTDDEDVLCGCMLHDTIEDTDTTKEEIEKVANARVAKLVSYESENKRGNINKEATWLDRKKEGIDLVKNSDDPGSRIIAISDKLSNLRSFNRLVLTKGENAWDAFNMKDPMMHYWYFEEFRKIFELELKDTAIYKEFCFMINAVFGKYINKEK